MTESIHSYKVIIPYREPTYEKHTAQSRDDPYRAQYFVTAVTESGAVNKALALFEKDERDSHVAWLRIPDKSGVEVEQFDKITINLKFSKGVFHEFCSGQGIRDHTEIIPEAPGIYAVCRCGIFDLVYIGKIKGDVNSPGSARDIFYKEHFTEHAGGSHLRRLVADKLHIPGSHDKANPFAIDPGYHEKVANFIASELFFSFFPADADNVEKLELTAIKELNPKWNKHHSFTEAGKKRPDKRNSDLQ
jgi:hypothetical protein